MIGPDEDPAPLVDDPFVRRELELDTPEADPRWRAELGVVVAVESRRRAAVRPRPPYLWPGAIGLLIVGLALLAVALGRV